MSEKLLLRIADKLIAVHHVLAPRVQHTGAQLSLSISWTDRKQPIASTIWPKAIMASCRLDLPEIPPQSIGQLLGTEIYISEWISDRSPKSILTQ